MPAKISYLPAQYQPRHSYPPSQCLVRTATQEQNGRILVSSHVESGSRIYEQSSRPKVSLTECLSNKEPRNGHRDRCDFNSRSTAIRRRREDKFTGLWAGIFVGRMAAVDGDGVYGGGETVESESSRPQTTTSEKVPRP